MNMCRTIACLPYVVCLAVCLVKMVAMPLRYVYVEFLDGLDAWTHRLDDRHKEYIENISISTRASRRSDLDGHHDVCPLRVGVAW